MKRSEQGHQAVISSKKMQFNVLLKNSCYDKSKKEWCVMQTTNWWI